MLLAWELGGGLGHLTKATLLAEPLLDAGCRVALAVRELSAVQSLLPEDYTVFQAPVAPALIGWAAPSDYAELLLHAGFGDAAGLAGRVRAWHSLFRASGARVLIADHSPTAVLAARCCGLPVVLYGNGFFAPPRPWPVFRDWEPTDPQRRLQARQHVLGAVNACLAGHGATPLTELDALLEGCHHALCTLPELDHYRRGSGSYHGPLFVDQVGVAPAWPEGAGPRVFAYLKPGLVGLDCLLEALVNLKVPVLVRCHGIDPARSRRWSGSLLSITAQMVRVDAVCQQADLVLCSGSDMAHGVALRGVPVFGLPTNAEQRVAFQRLAEIGVGDWCLPDQVSVIDCQGQLQRLLGDGRMRGAARALAQRHAGYQPHAAAQSLARTLLDQHFPECPL